MNKYTFGLENELIMVNDLGIPQYTIDGQKTSTLLISALCNQYSNLKDSIKPELDSCQIELVNRQPHTSLSGAADEIADIINTVELVADKYDLKISSNVAPQTIEPYITSDSQYPEITERYSSIGSLLNNLGVRSSTNIAGLHINIGHQHNSNVLRIHKEISEYMHALFLENQLPLDMDIQRFIKYKQVTDAIGESYLPLIRNHTMGYLNQEGNPIEQGHTLVRLKKYTDNLVTELRTPDAGTSANDLLDKVAKQSKFLSQFL